MAKKKEPTFWSVSANGKTASGGYAQRNRRKQAKGQGCAVLLVVGGGLLAGVAYFLSEAARWVQ